MNRSAQIIRTSIVGIVTNVLLAAFKALVGFLSSSIAIVMDAVNNLSDALSSAIIIAVIVLSAGITSLIESVKKIIEPTEPSYKTTTLIVIIVAIVVKLLLGWYVKRQGTRLKSDALTARKDLDQIHGFFYDEKENLVTVDVIPDLSVKDEPALCEELTRELGALLPGKTVLVTVDHNYSE